MRPDFIITEQRSPNIEFYIIVPTHTLAQNWMVAHTDARERRSMSAHLTHERMQIFIVDAAIEGMTFKQPISPQPAWTSPKCQPLK
jgi:hypothetical protein